MNLAQQKIRSHLCFVSTEQYVTIQYSTVRFFILPFTLIRFTLPLPKVPLLCSHGVFHLHIVSFACRWANREESVAQCCFRCPYERVWTNGILLFNILYFWQCQSMNSTEKWERAINFMKDWLFMSCF